MSKICNRKYRKIRTGPKKNTELKNWNKHVDAVLLGQLKEKLSQVLERRPLVEIYSLIEDVVSEKAKRDVKLW